jgi:hypothetical protein
LIKFQVVFKNTCHIFHSVFDTVTLQFRQDLGAAETGSIALLSLGGLLPALGLPDDGVARARHISLGQGLGQTRATISHGGKTVSKLQLLFEFVNRTSHV